MSTATVIGVKNLTCRLGVRRDAGHASPAAGRDGGFGLAGKSGVAKTKLIRLILKPGQPDGVILARGGRSQGYALWLKQGRPVFTVVTGGRTVSVEAGKAIDGWSTLTGAITADRTATLRVDGHLAGVAALPALIQHDPNDGMQIGADLGSPVVEPAPPKFTGSIERVRIFSGEAKP